MKKILSLVLAVIFVFSLVLPAFSAVNVNETKSQIPVIRISGDGEALYDADGNKIFHYRDLGDLVQRTILDRIFLLL